MYIENKSGGLSGGDARIGRVFFSKSGGTLHHQGKAFKSLKGLGFKANYFECEILLSEHSCQSSAVKSQAVGELRSVRRL